MQRNLKKVILRNIKRKCEFIETTRKDTHINNLRLNKYRTTHRKKTIKIRTLSEWIYKTAMYKSRKGISLGFKTFTHAKVVPRP